ncbi:tetratricopeptide repeat protein [Saccharopolyspora sp. WRP15-2]|uniref:Tetratricopeptide repeat protein n=1 Tax=Saccharopolyspora oryzae TaxID=2997343 RepID=A0ABT4UYX6_9PSEU|nr:tetratricopeptide repeat protein [Saccharopolyspora oryzae]MDA3626916.1 tetratricopeptide repeat protein [Saccharopolyspora oryzae]
MSDADVKVEQVRNLLEAKRFDLAKQQLAPLLAAWPDNYLLWQLLALAHLGSREHAEAQQAVSQALALNPQDEDLHLLMCKVLVAWDRIGEGITWAQRALELNPNSAEAHLQIANGLAVVEKHLDQALWHAQRARDLEPDAALTHCVLGTVLVSMGGKQAARQAREPLETALRLDPQLAVAWNVMGLAALRSGRIKEALRAFITTLQLNPQSGDAAHNLPLAVWALVSRGRWWIFALLIPTAVLSALAFTTTGIASVAIHVVGGALIAAGAWWALVLRIRNVFPESMRLAAINVLRRDRLVRPTLTGLAIGAVVQVLMVVGPIGPAGLGAAFWAAALGNFIGHRVSISRLNKATKALNAEREAQWLTVVTPQPSPAPARV